MGRVDPWGTGRRPFLARWFLRGGREAATGDFQSGSIFGFGPSLESAGFPLVSLRSKPQKGSLNKAQTNSQGHLIWSCDMGRLLSWQESMAKKSIWAIWGLINTPFGQIQMTMGSFSHLESQGSRRSEPQWFLIRCRNVKTQRRCGFIRMVSELGAGPTETHFVRCLDFATVRQMKVLDLRILVVPSLSLVFSGWISI